MYVRHSKQQWFGRTIERVEREGVGGSYNCRASKAGWCVSVLGDVSMMRLRIYEVLCMHACRVAAYSLMSFKTVFEAISLAPKNDVGTKSPTPPSFSPLSPQRVHSLPVQKTTADNHNRPFVQTVRRCHAIAHRGTHINTQVPPETHRSHRSHRPGAFLACSSLPLSLPGRRVAGPHAIRAAAGDVHAGRRARAGVRGEVSRSQEGGGRVRVRP